MTGHRCAVPRFGDEASGFPLRRSARRRAGRLRGPGRLRSAGFFQVVDGVQVHAQLVGDFRLEIARHGQVENEQRPLMAPAGDVFAIIVQCDDVPIGAGGADDDVGGDELIVQFVPGRGPAVPFGLPAIRRGRSCGSGRRFVSRRRRSGIEVFPGPSCRRRSTSTRLSSNRSKIREAKSAIATLGMLTRWR